MRRTLTIYGLTNDHGNICYVGMSSNPHARFRHHAINRRDFRVSGLAVLAETTKHQEARDLERRWIEFLGKDNLHNVIGGGGGDVLGRVGGMRPMMPFNIKFNDEQLRFLALTAKAQGHGNRSEVVKRIVNREMGRPTHY